jgi:hypothetical protein
MSGYTLKPGYAEECLSRLAMGNPDEWNTVIVGKSDIEQSRFIGLRGIQGQSWAVFRVGNGMRFLLQTAVMARD